MSDIFDEQKEWEDLEGTDLPDADEFTGMGDETETEIKTQRDCIKIMRAMKGHKLKDGGTITGFTVTITNKETKEKKKIKI